MDENSPNLNSTLPPQVSISPQLWLKKNLFSNLGNTLLTCLSLAVIYWLVSSVISRYAEVYLFIAVIYWLFCSGMSWFSRRLEGKNT